MLVSSSTRTHLVGALTDSMIKPAGEFLPGSNLISIASQDIVTVGDDPFVEVLALDRDVAITVVRHAPVFLVGDVDVEFFPSLDLVPVGLHRAVACTEVFAVPGFEGPLLIAKVNWLDLFPRTDISSIGGHALTAR